MNILYKYKFELSADSGKVSLFTVSSSEEQAINIIMKAENCPRNSIKFINKEIINTFDDKESTHDILREILINNGNPEFGDVIIDEICALFNYPTTD